MVENDSPLLVLLDQPLAAYVATNSLRQLTNSVRQLDTHFRVTNLNGPFLAGSTPIFATVTKPVRRSTCVHRFNVLLVTVRATVSIFSS